MSVADFSKLSEEVIGEVSKVLIGQRELLEQTFVALCARGHVLIEGVPGVGKTLLVRALSHVLGVEFRRIQFTPDLMPSDVTGSNVFNAKESRFEFNAGPVFTELLLADEINRAPAKTQAALLEAMQERSVTVDGITRELPHPFLVIATQNPIESQGTYPLPEAQLDRFLLKIAVNHPSRDTEKRVLKNYLAGFDPNELEKVGLRRLVNAAQTRELQNVLADVNVADEVLDYVTDIVGRTRVHPSVYLGASPRASIGLLNAARAHAALAGRDFVAPDDVKSYALPVLRHRLVLHPDAELESVSADDCITAILRETPVPKAAAFS